MALRGFLMLLRVKSVGFPSSLWKINVLTWCGWPKMNHARSSWKQVSFQEENVHQFLQNSEACCWHNARQSYNHCHILHNFSFTTSSSAIQSTARTRRRSPIQLHQDKAAAHKARITLTYLDDNGIRLMEHSPYSPDLASCDFWLFPKIKSALARKPFSRTQDLPKAVHSYLLQSTEKAFRIWDEDATMYRKSREATLRECDCTSWNSRWIMGDID